MQTASVERSRHPAEPLLHVPACIPIPTRTPTRTPSTEETTLGRLFKAHLLVDLNHEVDSTLPDVQRGHVGQKVVAHEEAHEDKVVIYLDWVDAARSMDGMGGWTNGLGW